MSFFNATFNQMIILFTFMLIGFILHKSGILPEGTDQVISRIENYVLVPALIINNFMARCTIENLTSRLDAVIFCFIILSVCVLLGFLVSPLLSKNEEEKKIYRYSFAVANFGFVGTAVVKGIFGDDLLFNYMIYNLVSNIFTYSIGVIWLTAGKRKFSLKMLVNPTFISLAIGALLGVTGLKLPGFLNSVIAGASDCFSPMAMILTGFVVAGFDFKTLFTQKNVYIMSVIRLILIPVMTFGILKLLRAPDVVITVAICSTAMPLGLNTIVFPASCGGDTKIGASMAMVSSLMGIITIPVILSLILPV